jgi:hypothetical protein
LSGQGKAIVERDELERRRPTFRRYECRRKLQTIGGAQWMHTQESDGRFADEIARFDFLPARRQLR